MEFSDRKLNRMVVVRIVWFSVGKNYHFIKRLTSTVYPKLHHVLEILDSKTITISRENCVVSTHTKCEPNHHQQ